MNRFIVYNKQTNTTNNNNNHYNNWSLTTVSNPRVDRERAYLSKTRDEFSSMQQQQCVQHFTQSFSVSEFNSKRKLLRLPLQQQEQQQENVM